MQTNKNPKYNNVIKRLSDKENRRLEKCFIFNFEGDKCLKCKHLDGCNLFDDALRKIEDKHVYKGENRHLLTRRY